MQIVKQNLFRLYCLTENQNEDGHYELVPFSDNLAVFNEDVDEGEINESLDGLADVRLGGGSCQYFELVHGDVNSVGWTAFIGQKMVCNKL